MNIPTFCELFFCWYTSIVHEHGAWKLCKSTSDLYQWCESTGLTTIYVLLFARCFFVFPAVCGLIIWHTSRFHYFHKPQGLPFHSLSSHNWIPSSFMKDFFIYMEKNSRTENCHWSCLLHVSHDLAIGQCCCYIGTFILRYTFNRSLFFLIPFTIFSVMLHSQAVTWLLDCLANAIAFHKTSFIFLPHNRLSHDWIWVLQLCY
jgi:hypothetical protein